MGKFFTIEEMCRSNTARAKKLRNDPDLFVADNLNYLIDNLLDPIRERFGGPITVTSGYRNPILNRIVMGSATSQHLTGEAADLVCSDNKCLFNLIRESGLPFDQLIDEEGYAWIHVSLKRSGNRRQILHL